jgi:hypothetical protein
VGGDRRPSSGGVGDEPAPYEGIADEANKWIFVHFSQLLLTPLLALGVWMLLDGIQSLAATVARVFLVVWMVFFSAFDAIAGIAVGVLTRHANDLVGEEKATVVGAIDFLFQDSRLARGDNYSVLGILGQFSWVALVLAAIVALWRAGLFRLIVGATVSLRSSLPTPATRPRSGWSPSSLPSFCGSERRTAKLLRDGRRKRPRETRRLLQSQWRGGRYPGSGYRIKRRQRFSRISSS